MYYIIFNPTAGAGRSVKVMQQVEQHLKENSIRYEMAATQYARHSMALAAAAVGKGYEGILSVGGDGTLLEIAQILKGTDETLGVIPAGTGNDFRRAIGVPRDPVEALEVILQNDRKRIDVGLLGDGKVFLNVAGTGFDVEVIKYTDKVRRITTGGLAYYLGIVMSLFAYQNVRLMITANGRAFKKKALLIAIANGRCYAGGLMVAPESDAADGLFNVAVIAAMPKWRILLELPKMQRGEPEKIRGIEMFKCGEITIDCDKKLTFNLDGEVYGQTPATFRVCPGALNVFCGNAY
jgi:lipid kinase, YegS/Rv2252/BmrU family